MAESTILVREREGEEGAGTVEIELDSVDESRESRRPKIGPLRRTPPICFDKSGSKKKVLSFSDDPPEYATVLDEAAPALEYEAPPLSYEAVLAASPSDTQPSKTLTVEAPPTYMQLFGKEEPDGVGHTRRGEEGAGSRWTRIMDRLPRDVKSRIKFGLIVALFLVAFALSISMCSVGFTYYHSCSIKEVPIYLIVAGFIFLVEVTLHSLLCIAQKCSEDGSLYCLIRRFDCLAFFLFVWLLVGSNWVFRAGTRNQSDAIDYIIITNQTDDDIADEGYPSGSNARDTLGSDSSTSSDCPGGVYGFTVVLILFQYLVALILLICCCTATFRSRRQ